MNVKRSVTIQASNEIEAADRLKNGGTFECPVHRRTTSYTRIPSFANGEGATVVEACCQAAIDAVERAVNAPR